ncbi:hypothetical protein AM1_C0021 (plasmid) [Acaryochloris marina MBIC11017]|uniref:Uncharacterized protein n=1 Tax=Acaryochloris marina (strain MBIC 11017) TaxID=329726 RepID=A8ZMC0_ACAM1|nr:hypothetical protein AM1_C0021 [Acaryochloris marina MBIC11017]
MGQVLKVVWRQLLPNLPVIAAKYTWHINCFYIQCLTR